MDFSTRESVYAKEAAAMIGNIDSSSFFESISKANTTDNLAAYSKAVPQKKEMELSDIKNPMNKNDV